MNANIQTIANAIPSIAENCLTIDGNQCELGKLLEINELHWPHAIERDTLAAAIAKSGFQPTADDIGKALKLICAGIGSDAQVNAQWVHEHTGKIWDIAAREYLVSDTRAIRAIYALETGETDHELVLRETADSLEQWLEDNAMVNGNLTII